MEPKSSSPEQLSPSPEQQPHHQPEADPSYEAPLPSREAAPERRHEQAQQQAPVQPALDPSQIALPTPVQPAPAADEDDSSATSGVPDVAADEDLIEKEWVDKAKQIIEQTRDDPHKRETEVNKLQIDYLKKRYGKDLGDAT